jgi:uncharacterized protein (DUF1697 family)
MRGPVGLSGGLLIRTTPHKIPAYLSMPLVVFLRGVNVGGHRTFSPARLVADLKHLDAVNIGAAGTFVIRQPASQAVVRAELARRLPFDTHVIMCQGRDIARLLSAETSKTARVEADFVHFLSVLSAAPRGRVSLPLTFPEQGRWLLKVLARDGRLVTGVYRRQMEAIRYLGMLDKIFGTPATTRNWNTVKAIAKVLGQKSEVRSQKSKVSGEDGRSEKEGR